MNRGICLSLSALTLFLVACVGEPSVTTQEEQPTKESTGPFFRGEVGPGRYSEVVFGGRSAAEARLVRAQEGYFEDVEPMQVSNSTPQGKELFDLLKCQQCHVLYGESQKPDYNDKKAMKVFHLSITYLTLVFVALAVDPFVGQPLMPVPGAPA